MQESYLFGTHLLDWVLLLGFGVFYFLIVRDIRRCAKRAQYRALCLTRLYSVIDNLTDEW